MSASRHPRRLLVGLALALVLAPGLAGADERGEGRGVFGLGLIVGEPTGLSAKYYLADDTAIDAAIGGAFVGRGYQVHGDFLWHPWLIDRTASFAMPLYLGLGARILKRDAGGGDADHTRIGLRVPVGLLFDFTRVPLDVFVEVAGILDYRTRGESFGVDLNAGAGIRYYF